MAVTIPPRLKAEEIKVVLEGLAIRSYRRGKPIISTALKKRSFRLCWPEMNGSIYIDMLMKQRYWHR